MPSRAALSASVILLGHLCVSAPGCATQREPPDLEHQDVSLTFLHTSDIHARLFPYNMTVLASDEDHGMNQANAPFGGIARISHILARERAKSARSIYVDSGDCFQGAPVFNAFKGEAEIKAMSQLAPDAVVVGNHEFDEGVKNYYTQLSKFSTFPSVAANYLWEPGEPLGSIIQPYTIVNADGIRVAIIGIANFSSITSITEVGNSLHIIPLAMNDKDSPSILQDYIDFLRPQVDLVVGVSHAGLSEDQEIIKRTSGFDIVFGGHLHILLDPPKVVIDKSGRPVVLAHSGAFAKYVGRLDVVVRKKHGSIDAFEVAGHSYSFFPIDKTVPEDPIMLAFMTPYRLALHQKIDLTSVFGYSSKIIKRYSADGGDSPLGNLVAEAMRRQARVDVSMTNTLGIRADISPGAISLDTLYNVFPFNNTVALLYISGADLLTLLDFVTLRSATRGCVSQIQIAGLKFTMDCRVRRPAGSGDPCGPGGSCPAYTLCGPNDKCVPLPCVTPNDCPKDVFDEGNYKYQLTCIDLKCVVPPHVQRADPQNGIEGPVLTGCTSESNDLKQDCDVTEIPLQETGIYQMAANDYMAQGGSGFTLLKNNNTQYDTKVPMRDAVLEVMLRSPKCVEPCRREDGSFDLEACPAYKDCVRDVTTFEQGQCDLQDESDTPHPSKLCGVDDQACKKDVDCYQIPKACAYEGCVSCANDTACDASKGEACVQHVCVVKNQTCLAGRCRRPCSTSGDCPNAGFFGSQQLCVEGGCLPSAGSLCEGDDDCTPGIAVCVGADAKGCEKAADCGANECWLGRCVPKRAPCTAFGCAAQCEACVDDAHCGKDLRCSEGYCVVPIAACADNRCRARCVADSDCPARSMCDVVRHVCWPLDCARKLKPEEACHADALGRALKKCLMLSCPTADSDGRISRILPSTLEELPPDQQPDDDN